MNYTRLISVHSLTLLCIEKYLFLDFRQNIFQNQILFDCCIMKTSIFSFKNVTNCCSKITLYSLRYHCLQYIIELNHNMITKLTPETEVHRALCTDNQLNNYI